MNVQLINMHGNNGSVDDDPAAAMRYTEARLEKITHLMLDGIKKETVKFSPNFDDSETEPTVLPGLFPNLLVNGAKGIASGYATEMPPHNLSEIIDAIILRIKSPNCRFASLLEIVKGPDFPTGGIVYGEKGIYQAFERGRGKIQIKSRYTISPQKNYNLVNITEIPFGVVKSKLIKQIDDIRYNKTIDGINEIRDETDRAGLSIALELDKGLEPSKIMDYLLTKTDLQTYYSYNNVAIKDRAPKVLSLAELIDAYIAHQKKVNRNAIIFDQKKDSDRYEIVEGLIKVSVIADEIIKVIRNANGSRQGVIAALVANFDFSPKQAEAIALLRLYRLSKVDQEIYIDERNILAKKLQQYNLLLTNNNVFNNLIINKLRAMKKEFGVARKTEIVADLKQQNIKMEDLIKHEEIWLGISKSGYIKRFTNRIAEANKLTKYGLKEEDSLFFLSKVNTAAKLLIFTKLGNYLFIPIHKIKNIKYKEIGSHLNDFAAITPTEAIVGVIVVEDFRLNAYVTLITKLGRGKRTLINDFNVTRYSKALRAIKLDMQDELIGVDVSNGAQEILIITVGGMAVKYNEHHLSVYSPRSGGVKAISISDQNYVANFALINEEEIVGLISNKGQLKKIRVKNILNLSRRTSGKPLYKNPKSNPNIVIDVNKITPKSQVIFQTPTGLVETSFNEIDFSKADSGFSKGIHQKKISGKILEPMIINSKTIREIIHNEEEMFLKAEEKLKAISQVSIDDILKNL